MSVHTYLGICGSLREHSKNMGLLRCVQQELQGKHVFSIADIALIPFYVEGMKANEAVHTLAAQVREADALVLACPEYNYSMAPALKNALDWLSKEPANILAGKPVAIMGAGGGMGTARAQYHLRQTCVYLDLRPINKPEIFSNAFSPAFLEDGSVSDSPEGGKLKRQIAEVLAALALAVDKEKSWSAHSG